MDKNEFYEHLQKELKKVRKEQVTDIWATLPDRIGRHVRRKGIEFLLNYFYVPENMAKPKASNLEAKNENQSQL